MAQVYYIQSSVWNYQIFYKFRHFEEIFYILNNSLYKILFSQSIWLIWTPTLYAIRAFVRRRESSHTLLISKKCSRKLRTQELMGQIRKIFRAHLLPFFFKAKGDFVTCNPVCSRNLSEITKLAWNDFFFCLLNSNHTGISVILTLWHYFEIRRPTGQSHTRVTYFKNFPLQLNKLRIFAWGRMFGKI